MSDLQSLLRKYRDDKSNDTLKTKLLDYKIKIYSREEGPYLVRQYVRAQDDEKSLFHQIIQNNINTVRYELFDYFTLCLKNKNRDPAIIKDIYDILEKTDPESYMEDILEQFILGKQGDTESVKTQLGIEAFDKLYWKRVTANSGDEFIIKTLEKDNLVSHKIINTAQLHAKLMRSEITSEEIDVPASDIDFEKILETACKLNRHETIKILFEKHPELSLEAALKYAFSAYPAAIETITYLIKMGVELRHSHYLITCILDSNNSVAELFLDANQDININYIKSFKPHITEEYESALTLAIRLKQYGIVEKILQRPGVDVTIPDNKALQYAISDDQLELASILIGKGATIENEKILKHYAQLKDRRATSRAVNLLKMFPQIAEQPHFLTIFRENPDFMASVIKNEPNFALMLVKMFETKTHDLSLSSAEKEGYFQIIECIVSALIDSQHPFLKDVVAILPEDTFIYCCLKNLKTSSNPNFEKLKILLEIRQQTNPENKDQLYSTLQNSAHYSLGNDIRQIISTLSLPVSEEVYRKHHYTNLIRSGKVSPDSVADFIEEGADIENLLLAVLKNNRIELLQPLLEKIPDISPYINNLRTVVFEHTTENNISPFYHFMKELEGKTKSIIFDAFFKAKMDMDSSVLPYLISQNDFELAYKLAQHPNIDVTVENNAAIILAFEKKEMPLITLLRDKGAKLPDDIALQYLKRAYNNNDQKTIALLKTISNVDLSSLFVNATEFRRAAGYAHKQFLALPFNSGLSTERWANQRSVALLSNGECIDVPSDCINGLTAAIQLSNEKTDGELVTLEEISAVSGIPKENIGYVNIQALEAHTHQKVLKIVHRPNHEITHSMRAAAYITAYHQLVIEDDELPAYSTKDIEKIQLMMLFSVLGREDETGFSDSKKTGTYLYQSYRAASAIEFLKYVLDNWERHYQDVFNSKDEVYQMALVLELMGFPQIPLDIRALQPTPIMSIILNGNSPETLEKLEQTLRSYPNNNHFNRYLDEGLNSILPDESVPNMGRMASQKLLNYINSGHATDLLRCYKPGAVGKIQNGANCLDTFIGTYSDRYKSQKKKSAGQKSIIKETVDYFYFVRKMLDDFGEKETTQFKTDPHLIDEVTKNGHALETFLLANQGKSFSIVKHMTVTIYHNGEAVETSFENIINNMNFDDELKHNAHLYDGGKITSATIGQVVPRYIAHHLFQEGSFKLSPKRFDYCHYKEKTQLTHRVREIDLNNIQHRDIEKDIDTSLEAIDFLPRPSFLKTVSFSPFLAELTKKKVHEQCEDGVGITRASGKIILEFSNSDSAQNVLGSLHHLGALHTHPLIHHSKTEKKSITAEISENDYSDIKPYLKFKQVKPPSFHSVESEIVDQNGNISVLSLVKNANALICNHNSVKSSTYKESGLQYYLYQLDNPGTERPFRKPELTQAQRAIIIDQQSSARVTRGFFPTIAPEFQEPMTTPPSMEEYWENDSTPLPRDVPADRGTPQNTEFTKKNSQTLLSPNGNQQLFERIFLSTSPEFMIGIVSDVNDAHLHGERYIWTSNVVSVTKFWLASLNDDKKPEHTSLKALQKSLLHRENNELATWNELLVGTKKTGIKALLCSTDWKFFNEVPLSDRLNLICQAKLIKQEHGIDVPLLIAHKSSAPELYSESKMLDDLHTAYQAILNQTYPYSPHKNKDTEQSVIVKAFETLTGIQKTKEQTLLEYFTMLKLNKELIQMHLNDLQIIGTQVRELTYLQNELSSHRLDDIQVIQSLFTRNIALGHPQCIARLLEHIIKNDIEFDLSAPITEDEKNIFELIEYSIAHNKPEKISDLHEIRAALLDFAEQQAYISPVKTKRAKTMTFSTEQQQPFAPSKSPEKPTTASHIPVAAKPKRSS